MTGPKQVSTQPEMDMEMLCIHTKGYMQGYLQLPEKETIKSLIQYKLNTVCESLGLYMNGI